MIWTEKKATPSTKTDIFAILLYLFGKSWFKYVKTTELLLHLVSIIILHSHGQDVAQKTFVFRVKLQPPYHTQQSLHTNFLMLSVKQGSFRDRLLML